MKLVCAVKSEKVNVTHLHTTSMAAIISFNEWTWLRVLPINDYKNEQKSLRFVELWSHWWTDTTWQAIDKHRQRAGVRWLLPAQEPKQVQVQVGRKQEILRRTSDPDTEETTLHHILVVLPWQPTYTTQTVLPYMLVVFPWQPTYTEAKDENA